MKNYRMQMVEALNAAKVESTGHTKSALKRIVKVTGPDVIIDAIMSGILSGPLQGNSPITINCVITKIRDNIASEYLFKIIEHGIGAAEHRKFLALIGRQNDFLNQQIAKKRVDGFTPTCRHNLIRLLMGIDGTRVSSSTPRLRTMLRKTNKVKLIEKAKSDTAKLRPFIQLVTDKFNETAKYFDYVHVHSTHAKTVHVQRITNHSFYENYMLKEPAKLLDMKLAVECIQSTTIMTQGIDSIVNMPYTLDNEFNNIMLKVIEDPIFDKIMKGKSMDEQSVKTKTTQAREYILEGVNFWTEIGKTNFYSKYVVDFRGRITQYGGISSVGSKPCKAMLRSGKAAPMGKHGYKHLLIAIAGAMGLDKETFAVREAYARDNLDRFIDIGCKLPILPVQAFEELLDADDPFAAAAYCLELARYDKDKTYESNVFVGYDATSSAVQLVGLLMGNMTLTEASNIRVDEYTEDKIHDSYMLLADIMDKAAPKFKNEENADIMDMWLGFDQKIKRAFAKPLMMTRLYGSKFGTWRDRTRETAIEKGIIDPSNTELVRRFGLEMARLFGFAFDNEEGFNCLRSYEDFAKEIAAAYASKNLPTIWTLQDGTHFKGQEIKSEYKKFDGEAYTAYVDGKKKTMRSYGLELLNDCLSELTLTEDVVLNKAKLKSAISPNYIHSHDALLLYKAVLKLNQPMRLTHDCFGAVPGHAEAMLEALNETCVELFGDNNLKQLESWRDECYIRTGIEVDLPSNYREEGISSEEIAKAVYKFS